MEIRQLVQFVMVAELKNFRRAAERLHMAQPPLSQAIRRLEQDLNVRLFDRTSRVVKLTAAGEVFLADAKRILVQLDSAMLATRQIAQGRSGRLNVGLTVPWAYEVVVPLLQTFRDQNSNVLLSLGEVHSSEQVEALGKGTLDVGFVRLPKKYDEAPWMKTFPLRKDRLVVALPVAHHLAGKTSFRIEDLRTEDFILYPFRLGPDIERFSFRMQIVNLCGEAGYAPQVVQEATQLHTIIRLVEAGFGISLVPEWTSRYFSSQVVYRNLVSKSDWSHITLSAAWNPGNRSPVLARFLEAIGVVSAIEVEGV